MIKSYSNGIDFLNENKDYLDTNPYIAVFFYIDSKVLHKIDKDNYAIKVEEGNDKLLAIKVSPYNLILFGNSSLTEGLFKYLDSNNLNSDGIICEESIGLKLIENHNYTLQIGMDFMESKDITLANSDLVLTASLSDADQIYQLSYDFFRDCGLPDIPDKEKIKENIERYKVIKDNGKIVSMAAFNNDTDKSYRVTHVYTIPSKRGLGYAKKIVNVIKNEIINRGFIATLNVDKKNPISYHIYESLGFKKVFTQGIYKKNS